VKNSSLWIVLHKMRTPAIVIIVTYTISIIGLLLIDGVDNDGNPYKMSIFDAFYFITYTASTIGFGETPYEFTYSQKIWVTFCIYFTVIGWFYGVGAFVTLLQNKMLIEEVDRLNFRWQVRGIKRKFIIILGFNYVTSEIIKKAIESDIRTVVIELDENKANNLILENYTPTVPILVADAKDQNSLYGAGLKNTNCKAVVSLFDDDELNLTVAVKTKLINKNVSLAVKSSSSNHTENLQDIDVDIIVNIFEIIAKELKMALNAPHLLKLEKWLYKIDKLDTRVPGIPKGKYLICGYGRLGKHIYKVLKHEDVELHFIEIDENKSRHLSQDEKNIITFANADDKKVQILADIRNTKAILAFTNNNTVNLSIIATAKKLNPEIITMAREESADDFSIFSNANIDYLFIPSKIMFNKTINALLNPLSDIFISSFVDQHEIWAQKLIRKLMVTIDEDPIVFELEINKNDAPQVYKALFNKIEVSLEIFMTSLYNRKRQNNVIPLLLVRNGDKFTLPEWNIKLEPEDRILFACDQNAKDDMEYIAQNVYEFRYALTGEEKKLFRGFR